MPETTSTSVSGDDRVAFSHTWTDTPPKGEVLFSATPVDPAVQATSGRQGETGPVYLYAYVIFGLFAYAFWLSGLLPLDPKLIANVTAHQLWVVGFLAGFSERFTQDLISRGAGILPVPKKA